MDAPPLILVSPTDQSFKVFTWNILAETYVSPSKYSRVDPEHLNGKYRVKLIAERIVSTAPDIACLQEVGMRLWKDGLSGPFTNAGYDTVFKYNESGEGVAILWKKSMCEIAIARVATKVHRFTLVKEKTFLFNPVAREYCGKLELAKELVLKQLCSDVRFIQSHNCVAFVMLQHTASGKRLIAVSTHLQPPRNAHTGIQIMQGWLILQELKLFFAPNSPTSLIWCGDFNMLPGSALYQFLHEGMLAIDPPPPTVPSVPSPAAPKPVVTHDLTLRSAYSVSREPLTHRTSHFNGTIDYIFVSTNSLRVCTLLYPNEQAARQGIPSENEPSDHLPLVAQLAFI